MNRIPFALIVIILFALAEPAMSQPTVAVSGTGFVEIEPDFAVLNIGVRVLDSSPVEAAREMSRRVEAVVDTLVSLGFPRDTIPSKAFDLRTERNYRTDGSITGYSASSSLIIRTAELERLAQIVGASLEAGATELSQIQFGSNDREVARQEALTKAVHAAKVDAEIIAKASDSILGVLIEIRSSRNPSIEYELPLAEQVKVQLDGVVSASTLVPQKIQVQAHVSASWTLISDKK